MSEDQKYELEHDHPERVLVFSGKPKPSYTLGTHDWEAGRPIGKKSRVENIIIPQSLPKIVTGGVSLTKSICPLDCTELKSRFRNKEFDQAEYEEDLEILKNAAQTARINKNGRLLLEANDNKACLEKYVLVCTPPKWRPQHEEEQEQLLAHKHMRIAAAIAEDKEKHKKK